MQQHQRRYNQATEDNLSQLVAFPGLSRQSSSKPESTEQSGFSSLAKYRVDRTKQQEQQQQQQTVKTDGGINFLQTAATQRYQPQLRQQLVNPGGQRFFDYQNDRQQVSPSQSIFEEEQKIRLNEYYEKQRQLEALKKQREQLILEQREIKRQQELLKLQQIRQQTSTTRFTTAAPTSPTVYVTTSSPLLLSSPTARRITPAESELFLKAIATHQKKFTTTTTTVKPFSTTVKGVSPSKIRQERVQQHGNSDEIPKDLLSLIQAQQPQLLAAGGKKPQIKIIYQTEKPTQTSLTSSSRSSNNSPTTSNSENELLLKQLKLALAQSADDNERNVTTRDLVLPNGKKLQLIQSPNGLSSIVPNDGSSQFQTVTKALEAATSTTTIKPAKAILDELTKGVLPPGADFEVLRHKDDGKLEDVGKSPIHNQPGKKVTFVVLEEQPDGSYKVQGVKGNAKENGVDVDSIVDKIKKGELKLPPRNAPALTSAASSSSNVLTTKENPTVKTTTSSTTYTPKPTTNTLPTTFRSTTIKHNNAPVTSRLKER